MDIREELRKIRKFSEISAKELAIKTNTSVNTIQSCENMRMMPNLKYLMKIADFLGYEIVLKKK